MQRHGIGHSAPWHSFIVFVLEAYGLTAVIADDDHVLIVVPHRGT